MICTSNNAKNETTIQIGDFVFKGLEDGNANIVVTGEFYNENGEEINISNNNLQIQIGNQEAEVEQLSQEQTNVSSDNTNLSILRLDKEGISPYFKKEVKEYYFIADETIDNLEVTAIPENKNATVTITGNKNLKIGRNTIIINIISEDKSKEETYKIYVTKTDDIEKANANLENLAVRSVDLYPEFDYNITQYEIEIANEVNKIDILAVPQNEKANVTIIGNDEMKVGDNIVQINVLAEDGITNKKYELAVHRRNEEEELLHQQEEELQIERLSSILQEQEENNIEDEKAESQKRIIKWIIIIVPISIIVVIVIIIIYKKIKNKNK